MKTVNRRIKILKYMSEVRNSNMLRLSTEFEVSISTIRRDVEYLSLHYPISTLSGKYGGVFVMENYYYGKGKLSSLQQETLEDVCGKVDDKTSKIIRSIISQFGFMKY